MIISAAPDAPPHFFLIGFRAPPGGTGPASEKRGVVITRSLLDFTGASVPAGDVKTKDEAFAGQSDSGPFRTEAEIPVWKPEPDVAIVADLASFLTPAEIADTNALPTTIAAKPSGSLAIDRGGGFGAPINRFYGHRPRGSGIRLGLAGDPGALNDPASLKGFDANQFDLPRGFDNAFTNSAPLPFEAPFKSGDRLRFTPAPGSPPPLDSLVPVLTIPAAPQLTVTENGAPLNPPLTLQPTVDTIVIDRTAHQFALVWRASFSWGPRFETAILTVQ